MKYFRTVYKYIQHFFSARHTYGFGVHSPFMYLFTRLVLCEKNSYYIFETIETLRRSLKNDSRVINITDFGTGFNRKRTIAEISKKSLKSVKYGQLLFRIANYIKAQNIIELGTSLGVTSAYLSSPSTQIKCLSLEGCPEIAQVALDNFEKLGIKNINVIVGNIDNTLTSSLNEFDRLDLIFIDANHSSEAVLRYFNQCLLKVHNETLMVIDDIYWSEDMESAWEIIKKHIQVTSTIDLFQLGIVFFNADLYKMHYKMRY